ncbi:unnamed protein product [Sordaria macrospora k-hell]|uniref:WGS project CABT00000000 data, contig 2.31 n=1 Tax=Sordaria macrospora (strain ATCC MYA-333 / DSM 997 / K(L3346) / K-hell) TaxID=771870 RepID=F7W5Q0_SORMK|nr:uncharacterized protein SMAC_12086 [Sordaria macrospora k-hell]CCC12838.1 unnamed protein product [Sordaria macrospora k-hell]
MPSARYIERPGGSRKSKGFIRSTYDSLTSAENASVVRSIAFFGAAVALLSSSWGEMLVVFVIPIVSQSCLYLRN